MKNLPSLSSLGKKNPEAFAHLFFKMMNTGKLKSINIPHKPNKTHRYLY